MYLREEKIKKEVGRKLVPYCKVCKSIDIETIQTCRHCGSLNIGYPNISYSNNSQDEEGLGIVPEYTEYVAKIYRCDKCGKEFDGKKIDNYLSWYDGDFESFKVADYEFYYDRDGQIYHLDYDLCEECKSKIVDKLKINLMNLLNPETIKEQVKKFMEE